MKNNFKVTKSSKDNKILDYIATKNYEYGDGPKPRSMVHELPILQNNINNKMSKTEEYDTYFNKKSPKYYKNRRDPSKSRDPGNVDIAWELPSEIEEDVYGKYLDLLKSGDLTPGTSFENFEQNYSNYDAKLLKKKKAIKDMRLSSAIQKIDNAMSGIMGTLNLEGGGSSNKPRPPKIKPLNLASYFKLGMRVADLTPSERQLVSELLKKTLSRKSDN